MNVRVLPDDDANTAVGDTVMVPVPLPAGVAIVSVNCWVALGLTPLEALRQKMVVPAGEEFVLAMVAVEPLGVNVTPVGRVVVFEHVPKFALEIEFTAGEPLVVTVKLLGVPVLKLVELALVNDGAMPAVVPVKLAVGELTQRVGPLAL